MIHFTGEMPFPSSKQQHQSTDNVKTRSKSELPELPSLVAQNFNNFDAFGTCYHNLNTVQWRMNLAINKHPDASFESRNYSHALICKQLISLQSTDISAAEKRLRSTIFSQKISITLQNKIVANQYAENKYWKLDAKTQLPFIAACKHQHK